MAEAKIILERLNNFNWASWRFRVELLLLREDLWAIVNEPKPDDATAAWTTKDGRARAVIGLALEDNQLCHVMGAVTANEMWTQLKGYHERGSLTNKIHVLRKLCSMRLGEGGSMSDHLVEVSELVHRLVSMGEGLQEHWVVAILLSSMPESYSPLITALEGRPEEELKLEYVKGKLLDEWRRRCESDDGMDKALKVFTRGGRSARLDGRSNEEARRSCFYCKQEGHFRRNCPELEAERQEESRQQKAKLTSAEEGRSSGRNVCFTAAGVGRKNEAGVSCSGKWIMDTGCSQHMSGEDGCLETLIECKEAVCLADGRRIFARGSGTARTTGVDGNGKMVQITLKNVLLVPGLNGNVLSVSRIIDEGYSVSFGPEGCTIQKGADVVLDGERKGGLYYVKQPKFEGSALRSSRR